jgi:hypothetical protein
MLHYMWRGTRVIWIACGLVQRVHYAALVKGLSLTPVPVSSYTSVCNYLELLGNEPRGLNMLEINYGHMGFLPNCSAFVSFNSCDYMKKHMVACDTVRCYVIYVSISLHCFSRVSEAITPHTTNLPRYLQKSSCQLIAKTNKQEDINLQYPN